MKTHLLTIAFLFLSLQAFAQNKPDIVLSDSLFFFRTSMDLGGNIHMGFKGSYSGIYYQTFNSSGIPIRNQRSIISSPWAGSPALAESKGSVLFLWNEMTMIFSSYIKGGVLDLAKDSLRTDIRISSTSGDIYRRSPEISLLNDSLAAGVWTGGSQVGHYDGVYGRLLSTELESKGPEVRFNDNENAECSSAKIAVKPAGSGYWVFWRDNRSGSYKVYAREVSITGIPQGSSILVSEDSRLTDLWFLDAAVDPKGNFTAVWGGQLNGLGYQIQLRRFDKDGKPLGASENVTSKEGGVGVAPSVSIAIDSLGNTVVAWDQEESKENMKIYAQRYSPDNKPLGTAFRVSGENEEYYQTLPIIKLKNGKIYCFWSESRDTTIERSKLSILEFNDPVADVKGSGEGAAVRGFMLSQNYPNPFNPATTISYMIPKESFVELKVFDMLGREAATLVNKEQSAGQYTVHFDGSSLPSGIYIYTIRAGSYTGSKKLMILK